MSNRRLHLGLACGLWLAPLVLLLESALRPIAEPDLFFYLALVQRYLHTGHWPVTDPFTYTLANDTLMTLHQWLGYWLFYWPYQTLGWAGPILLKTLIVFGAFLFPLGPFLARRRSALPYYFPLAWTLAIFIAHHRFRERVSLFGDLFTIILVCGLFWHSRRKQFWYCLPLMFLAWAQLHPSYPLGWVILLGFITLSGREQWSKLQLASVALCFLLPFCNPLGFEGVRYPFQFSLEVEPYLRQYVVEWLPLTDPRLFGFSFLYLPFITLVPLLAWRLWQVRGERRYFEWFIFTLALFLSLKSVRFGLLAEGLFLALLAGLELRSPMVQPRWALVGVATGVLALTMVKITFSPSLHLGLAQRLDIDTGYFPAESVDVLNENRPSLHIFNSFGFGGYLAWRWQGDPPIFFHGFSTNFRFFEDNYNHPQESQADLDELVRKYDIGVFLLSRMGNDGNFIDLLEKHKGWQKMRSDPAAVIFVKRDPRVFRFP